MALPSGFFQFGNKEIRLADVMAIETFEREPASFFVRVWLQNGVFFTQEFGRDSVGPTVDEANRDALQLALETAL